MILYGVLAAAVLGAVWGAYAYVKGLGYSEAEAEWKPKYERTVTERESWKVKSAECSASIVAEQQKADERDAAARKIILAEKARADANRNAMRAAEARAANPPEGSTCNSAVIAVTEALP